jgi:hypothetical protein
MQTFLDAMPMTKEKMIAGWLRRTSNPIARQAPAVRSNFG